MHDQRQTSSSLLLLLPLRMRKPHLTACIVHICCAADTLTQCSSRGMHPKKKARWASCILFHCWTLFCLPDRRVSPTFLQIWYANCRNITIWMTYISTLKLFLSHSQIENWIRGEEEHAAIVSQPASQHPCLALLLCSSSSSTRRKTNAATAKMRIYSARAMSDSRVWVAEFRTQTLYHENVEVSLIRQKKSKDLQRLS